MCSWMFLALALAHPEGASSPEPTQLVGVRQLVIDSKVMKARRRLWVYLPDGHDEAPERFPVLYLPVADGHRLHYASGVTRLLARRKLIPPMIVVGVLDVNGRRDFTPTKIAGQGESGGSDRFLSYLADEVVPLVEKRFKAGPRRVFCGHSIVGAFGLYSALSKPELFEGTLVSSPWVIYDGEARFLHANVKRFVDQRTQRRTFIYVSCGKEPRLQDPIEELVVAMKKGASSGLRCRYVHLPEETHDTTMIQTLPAGLRAFFARE